MTDALSRAAAFSSRSMSYGFHQYQLGELHFVLSRSLTFKRHILVHLHETTTLLYFFDQDCLYDMDRNFSTRFMIPSGHLVILPIERLSSALKVNLCNAKYT